MANGKTAPSTPTPAGCWFHAQPSCVTHAPVTPRSRVFLSRISATKNVVHQLPLVSLTVATTTRLSNFPNDWHPGPTFHTPLRAISAPTTGNKQTETI